MISDLLNTLPPTRAWEGSKTAELVRHPGDFGLGQVPAHLTPNATTDLICGFCSTGCSLTAHLRDGEAINITPASDYPVNIGMACPKGWEALAPLSAPDRATVPLLRHDRGGDLEPADWHTALRYFCDRFKSIQQRHGTESVAFLSTGQICTEEMALLGALAKFGMGMKHGDGNTRQCMATSATAYKESFGFDAPPYTYKDFEESDVLVFIGSNPCIAHPIMWQRVLRNPNDPDIIVLDPRRTETAVAATQHYPLKPKSDLTLLYGLANRLIELGAVDEEFVREHTNHFESFREHVRAFPMKRMVEESGLNADQIEKLARTIAKGERVSFWWTMGVNQGHESTRTAQAIINLALLTGNIGRPGTGANSITGQCNAMGSRLFSNTTNLLGGHDFGNPDHRRKVAEILEIDGASIPDEPGWAYDQILDGIEAGKIKGLWIIATNTLHSWIDQERARELLGKLEFLVMQDLYSNTDTARQAHLLLPAAGWGEKEGTFINSERRFGLVKQVARAPGEALSDFRIFQLIAHYWGCVHLFRKWHSPEAVFELLKKLSENQPFDITGIADYRMIDDFGGIQWPFPEGSLPMRRQRRLFSCGRFFHQDGRARFVFDQPQPMPEPPSEAFPFVLLTGRGSSSDWHTRTRTSKSAVLRKLAPQRSYVEIHPDDAAKLGINPHDRVCVASARSEVTVTAFVTPTVQPGQVFMPMHFEETNRLTHWSVDPHSRQPACKACAVKVGKAGQS